MSFTSVLLLLQVAAAAGSAANDDTLLLQVTGQQPADEAASLLGGHSSEMAQLLAKPEAVFDDIHSKVSALEKDLAEMKQRNEVNLESHVKMFKKVLEEQLANNTALSKVNDEVKSEIVSLTASNADKRQAAKELTKDIQDLADNLKHARELIETTDEYVHRSLEKLADTDAAELKVLAELDQHDAESRAAAEHTNRLVAVGNLAEVSDDVHHRSLLAVGSAGRIAKAEGDSTPDVEGLVKGLGSGLSEFAQRAQEGESQLKARFQASYKLGAEKTAALLEEQKSFVASRAHLLNLEKRLTGALTHLQEKKKALEENTRSLQGFTRQHLGKLSDAQSPR